MNDPLHILILEDSAADAELVAHLLREGGLQFSAERVERREDYERQLEQRPPDLILSDYAFPSFDGDTALRIAKSCLPNVPFIFVTGTMGEEVAIETLKNGATDYVLKTRLSRLLPAVERALREARERRERQRAETELRRSHQQLRALTAHLQHVREQERTRIAREVHDELGQALTGMKMDLAFLARELTKGRRSLLERTRAITGSVEAAIQTVRRIATELRPGILDDLGLLAAIEWQANEFQARTGIECRVHSTASEAIRDPQFNTAVFRIFQETLTNIIRHAGATRVDVEMSETDDQFVLIVRDNGRGITDEEITSTHSIGLLGMRERVALLGGDIRFHGQPGQGTTVTVAIPWTLRPHSQPQSSHENPDYGRPRDGAPRTETDPGGGVQTGQLRRSRQRPGGP